MGPRSHVRRAPSTLWERFDSETLVLDPDSNRSVRLNATGSRLWEALGGPREPGQLAAILVREWGLDERHALSDVEAFLAALDERGLLEIEPS